MLSAASASGTSSVTIGSRGVTSRFSSGKTQFSTSRGTDIRGSGRDTAGGGGRRDGMLRFRRMVDF